MNYNKSKKGFRKTKQPADEVSTLPIGVPRVGKWTHIYPRAELAISATVGTGCKISSHVRILDNVILGDDVKVGIQSIIRQGAYIGHNTVIEKYCEIGANVVIGQGCYIESGVEIKPGICITDKVKIGSGSVVKENVL